MISAAVSQIISNVPAAVLLSGFTPYYRELLYGVSAGGLGTLIASLASLISYKLYIREYGAAKYLRFFLLLNFAFLSALLIMLLTIVKILN
jgi:Na+/H+ antiporter NhaD/arsenite permease-like protein